jgi:hypothetical protein
MDVLGREPHDEAQVWTFGRTNWRSIWAWKLIFGQRARCTPVSSLPISTPCAARLTDKGVKVTWDDNFPGHRRFYVADCYGNRLEFSSPTAT